MSCLVPKLQASKRRCEQARRRDGGVLSLLDALSSCAESPDSAHRTNGRALADRPFPHNKEIDEPSTLTSCRPLHRKKRSTERFGVDHPIESPCMPIACGCAA